MAHVVLGWSFNHSNKVGDNNSATDSVTLCLTVPTKQQRIAELARQSPEMGFTSLAYFMDINWLSQAYHRTRKDGTLVLVS